MNFKQQYISSALKPLENNTYGKNDSSKNFNQSSVIASMGNAAENHLMIRLQEMEVK